MSPLALLTDLLSQANAQGPISMRPCAEIDEVCAQLEKHVRSGGSNNIPRDLQIEAVKRFWKTGGFGSLREARLVAFGLGVQPWNDRRCLMEDQERFGAALSGLSQWEGSPRQFRKCYQGLVRSYFDYDGLGRDVPGTGKKNWRRLQAYLHDTAFLTKDETLNPDWVGCALENRGLFSETPCAAYAQDLLDGREVKVNHVRDLLGITDASWFTRELVLSQIARACRQDHLAFTKMMPKLLVLLGSNEVLRDRGLQMLLDRYVQVPQTPQHLALKEYSVNAWGNPWLPSNEHRWGGVTDQARQMVGDWLKLEFIELFFTKLAQDGLSDTRRVKFWVRYVPVIENIHFALGRHAMFSTERDFIELRTKLKGLIVELEDSKLFNNAFVMTMGDLVAVEFSGEANAFFGYSVKRKLPFDLSQPVRSAPVNGKNSLKHDSRVLYLRHQDNLYDYVRWEDRFKNELLVNFGVMPGRSTVRRPVTTTIERPYAPTSLIEGYSEENLKRYARRINATIINRRNKGRAIWIQTGDSPDVRRVLEEWGFRYSDGLGWWKKDAE